MKHYSTISVVPAMPAIGQTGCRQLSTFEKALAIKPNYAEVHNNLGVTFQELTQLDAAVKSYEKALAIKPDYADCA